MNNFYNTYSHFLKNKFKTKVYKIPININTTCPNRDGTKGYGGCIYCSPWGSGMKTDLNTKQQIEEFIKFRKDKKEKYIAYFQAFSNMYGEEDYLINEFKKIFLNRNIIGIAIATRPDTVNKSILKRIKDIFNNYFIQIELGLESANNETLKNMNRKDVSETFINAINIVKEYIPNAHIVGHIIIGLPGENYSDFLNSTQMVYQSKCNGIKFHNLYIEKDMPIYKNFQKNRIPVMKENEYIDILLKLIEELPKDIVIHRLKSISNEERLIAPEWTNDRTFFNKLYERAKDLKSYQGKKYGNNDFNHW